MLFVLIGLWTIGLLLLVTDPKRPTTRWIASIAFTGGSGGLSAVLADDWIPYIRAKGWLTDPIAVMLAKAESVSSLVCYYGLPFTFVMFASVYHPAWLTKERLRTWYPWALLVPVAGSFAVPHAVGDPIPYRYVILWAAPYICGGIGLLIHATVIEKNSFLRKARMLTSLAAAPTLLFALFTMYVLPGYFGLYEWWRYNAAVIGFTLAVILVSSMRYGFMGLQISIRNQKLDYTLRAITSGTSILNHAIKNDVGKIRLFGDKIKSEAGSSDPEQLIEDVNVILNASQHIYDMIYRIQGQTQEVELQLEELKPSELLEQSLLMLAPSLQHIELEKELRYAGSIWGDRAQLAEVFSNILTNAIEAMPQGGRLIVRLTESKRSISIEMKDSGTGMDKKQLKRMFDPFYTTKSGQKLNFGLGMSYSYHVIQKHKGTMTVHSKPGAGTSVFINFSKRKGVSG